MVELNTIYNEDCFETIKRMDDGSVDVVLTSPPYNNSRTSHSEYSMNTRNCRYIDFDDNKTNDEYSNWTVELFNGYDRILKPNGVVLYNISYGNENPNVLWETLFAIMHNTNFMIAETIIWKKKSAFPNNVSHNHLTRITEFVFVFCRKWEYETFTTNKQIKSYSNIGQPFYENIFNYIEAKNNDEKCPINGATYSTELCEKLLNIFASPQSTIYDSFMGTGTTAVACKLLGLNYIGSEISKQQWEWSMNRLGETKTKDNKVTKSLW